MTAIKSEALFLASASQLIPVFEVNQTKVFSLSQRWKTFPINLSFLRKVQILAHVVTNDDDDNNDDGDDDGDDGEQKVQNNKHAKK